MLLSSVKSLASVKGAAHWERLLVLAIQIRYLVYPCCFLLSQDVYLQLAVPMLLNLAIVVLVFLIYLYSPVPCASLPLLLFVLFEALVMLLVEIYLLFSQQIGESFVIPLIYFIIALCAIFSVIFLKDLLKLFYKMFKGIKKLLYKFKRKKANSAVIKARKVKYFKRRRSRTWIN